MSGKRSGGLDTYAKAVEREEKAAGRSSLPTYADGTTYKIGDRIPQGEVIYFRPLRPHEHEAECPGADGKACRCSDPWRFVVRSAATSVVQPVAPSSVVPWRELDERTIVSWEPASRTDLCVLHLSCGHTSLVTATLARILQRPGAPEPICHAAPCRRVATRLG